MAHTYWTRRAPTDGAEVVAKRLQRIARMQSIDALSPSSSQQQLAGTPRARAERAGSVRLRDAIVWGYMMQRPHARTKAGSSVLANVKFSQQPLPMLFLVSAPLPFVILPSCPGIADCKGRRAV